MYSRSAVRRLLDHLIFVELFEKGSMASCRVAEFVDGDFLESSGSARRKRP
jgi:hypothetical protein